MMRSLYSGVSGLKTHQTKMDVIGNNIANVNTVAYKAGSVSFQELMYQTTSNAAGADATRGTGGVNPKQIGLGVTNGAISNSITTQGAAQTTNDPFDLRIEGESFFVVNNGSENYYTRAGAFYVDGAGNLAMKTTGYNVMGWTCDENGTYADDISALRIMSPENLISNPEATTKASISGILDKNGAKLNEGGQSVSIPFYDELGYSYTAKYNIVPVKDTTTGLNKDGQYRIFLTNIVDSNGDTIGATNFLERRSKTVNGTEDSTINTGFANMSANELVFGDVNNTTDVPATYSITTSVKNKGTADEATSYMVKSADGTEKNFTKKSEAIAYYNSLTGLNYSETDLGNDDGNNLGDTFYITGYTLNYNVADGSFETIGGQLQADMYLNNVKNNQALKTVTIDFKDSKNISNGGVPTIEGASENGKRVGTMTSLSVDQQGRINASYSNGNSRVLGKICVATFSNASGLEKQGENLYSASLNSGEASINEIAAKSEKMTSGNLEMSNVDLSNEFTEMITTQRGFQANSRIITTSDTLLEELVNLKR